MCFWLPFRFSFERLFAHICQMYSFALCSRIRCVVNMLRFWSMWTMAPRCHAIWALRSCVDTVFAAAKDLFSLVISPFAFNPIWMRTQNGSKCDSNWWIFHFVCQMVIFWRNNNDPRELTPSLSLSRPLSDSLISIEHTILKTKDKQTWFSIFMPSIRACHSLNEHWTATSMDVMSESVLWHRCAADEKCRIHQRNEQKF